MGNKHTTMVRSSFIIFINCCHIYYTLVRVLVSIDIAYVDKHVSVEYMALLHIYKNVADAQLQCSAIYLPTPGTIAMHNLIDLDHMFALSYKYSTHWQAVIWDTHLNSRPSVNSHPKAEICTGYARRTGTENFLAVPLEPTCDAIQ